jgi:hypothetical protein
MRREDVRAPFESPRDPRPEGAQKGVAKRDNGRSSRFANARVPAGNRGQPTRGCERTKENKG